MNVKTYRHLRRLVAPQTFCSACGEIMPHSMLSMHAFTCHMLEPYVDSDAYEPFGGWQGAALRGDDEV